MAEWRPLIRHHRPAPTGPQIQELRGKDCTVLLEPRPSYCDRGRWIAKVCCDEGSKLALDLDAADAWPRYYFDEQRAKLEVEAWLSCRQQAL